MEPIVALDISDLEWLQAMVDLEDMQEYEIVKANTRYREHLSSAKRALGLQHLAQEN
jgi:hypothetical protein